MDDTASTTSTADDIVELQMENKLELAVLCTMHIFVTPDIQMCYIFSMMVENELRHFSKRCVGDDCADTAEATYDTHQF